MEKTVEKTTLIESRENVAGDELLDFDEIRTSLLVMAESVLWLTAFHR
jgi:hypothetical protein